jgi:inositol phosphorylceramide mannosyltransferase catalytic subunit
MEYHHLHPLSNNKKLKAFFGQMGSNKSFSASVPNAWMASPPGHPFFLLMLHWMHIKLTKGNAKLRPEELTGPEALYNGIKEYEKDIGHTSLLDPQYQRKQLFPGSNPSTGHEVVLLPSWYIYPYSWAQEGMEFVDICSAQRILFNPVTCKDRIGVNRLHSYTITYWSHTWTRWGSNLLNTWAVSI